MYNLPASVHFVSEDQVTLHPTFIINEFVTERS
jgi:hypothetical protein